MQLFDFVPLLLRIWKKASFSWFSFCIKYFNDFASTSMHFFYDKKIKCFFLLGFFHCFSRTKRILYSYCTHINFPLTQLFLSHFFLFVFSSSLQLNMIKTFIYILKALNGVKGNFYQTILLMCIKVKALVNNWLGETNERSTKKSAALTSVSGECIWVYGKRIFGSEEKKSFNRKQLLDLDQKNFNKKSQVLFFAISSINANLQKSMHFRKDCPERIVVFRREFIMKRRIFAMAIKPWLWYQ